jgi:outer membrane protein TolC
MVACRASPLIAVTLSIASCATAAQRRETLLVVDSPDAVVERAREPSPPVDEIEKRLADRVALSDVLTLARAHNPSLRAARGRVRATIDDAKSATRLPDPAIKGEIWGAPLVEPWALDKSQTLMIGMKQELPLADLVSSKRDAADARAAVAGAELESKERDVVRDLAAAFVRYRLAFEERALHVEHIHVSEATIDALRAAQASGRASEADVSAAIVALNAAHTELFALEADDAGARAELNAAMGRKSTAPLGAPSDDDEMHAQISSPTQTAMNDAVKRARANAAASDAEARVAENDANLPTVMAGVDYWYIPTSRDPNAYGAMLSVSLPWLNAGRAGDVEAAQERRGAADAELQAVTVEVDRMRTEAEARVQALEKTLAAIDEDEIPSAEHNVEATKSAFTAGASDARAILQSNAMLVDARLRRARVRAELALARVDLARILGTLGTLGADDGVIR